MSYNSKNPPPTPTRNFLTNSTHVLVVLSRDSMARIRDIADEVGMTHRAVQRILAELIEDDILKVTKYGRRNKYRINRRKRLKHALEADKSVGDLLDLIS